MGATFDAEFARGSEFLRAGQLAEAAEALGAALADLPGEPRALALLGLTYFRSAQFIEAKEIYEALVERAPEDASHHLNLGLVHLKLGETEAAVSSLEASRNLDPSPGRASNYLGLAYARAGRFAAAYQAFLAAGQSELADEVSANLTDAERVELGLPAPGTGAEVAAAPVEAAAAAPPPRSREPSKTPPRAREPSKAPPRSREPSKAPPRAREPERAPSRPPPQLPSYASGTPGQGPRLLTDYAVSRLLRAEPGAHPIEVIEGGALALRVSGRMFARTDGVAMASGELRAEPAMRRARGVSIDEPFAHGGAPMYLLEGQGQLLATPRGGGFAAVVLDDDILYLREELVFAFTPELRWECGFIPGAHGAAPMAQFRGRGVVALRTAAPLIGARVGSAPVAVAVDALAGWVGRVVPRGVPGDDRPWRTGLQIVCGGEGVVLLQDPPPPPPVGVEVVAEEPAEAYVDPIVAAGLDAASLMGDDDAAAEADRDTF